MPHPDPLTAARALLAEPVPQPVTMTHAEIWELLSRYQRRLSELADYCGAEVSEYAGPEPTEPEPIAETVARLAAEANANLQEITRLCRQVTG